MQRFQELLTRATPAGGDGPPRSPAMPQKSSSRWGRLGSLPVSGGAEPEVRVLPLSRGQAQDAAAVRGAGARLHPLRGRRSEAEGGVSPSLWLLGACGDVSRERCLFSTPEVCPHPGNKEQKKPQTNPKQNLTITEKTQRAAKPSPGPPQRAAGAGPAPPVLTVGVCPSRLPRCPSPQARSSREGGGSEALGQGQRDRRRRRRSGGEEAASPGVASA